MELLHEIGDVFPLSPLDVSLEHLEGVVNLERKFAVTTYPLKCEYSHGSP